MKKRSEIISTLLAGSIIFTLASCGNDKSDKSKNVSKQEEQQQQRDEGLYRAVLKPLNTKLAGTTSGTVQISIKGDEVIAESNIAGSPGGVKHLQNIMVGTTCPEEGHDTNQDQIIDIAETLSTSGPFLLPLDSDLSAQLDGMSFGPIANNSGSYVYRRSTTLSHLLSDLGSLDPDPSDSVAKLSPGESLNLAGRVVVVHGVRQSVELPQTVETLGELPVESLLPIACGKLVRIIEENSEASATSDLID